MFVSSSFGLEAVDLAHKSLVSKSSLCARGHG